MVLQEHFAVIINFEKCKIKKILYRNALQKIMCKICETLCIVRKKYTIEQLNREPSLTTIDQLCRCGEGCARRRDQPLPRPMACQRSGKGTPSATRSTNCICFQLQHNIFYCLLPAKLFPQPLKSRFGSAYFFNAAEIDFLITNRTTNIIAWRSVRLINLGLAERCIYWFCDVCIACSTLGVDRCLLQHQYITVHLLTVVRATSTVFYCVE